MSDKEDSRAYREGKKALEFKHRNFMLSPKAIEAIEVIAKGAGITKGEAVERALITMANKEYDAGIEITEKLGNAEIVDKIYKLEDKLQRFIKVVMNDWYGKDNILELLKKIEKKRDENEDITSEEFYNEKIRKKKIVKNDEGENAVKLDSFDEYFLIVDAFGDEDDES